MSHSDPATGNLISTSKGEVRALASTSAAQGLASDHSFERYIATSETAARLGQVMRMSIAEFDRTWAGAFSSTELALTVIPERTLARRRANDEFLTADETEKAIRLARTVLEAKRVFADSDKASRWLRKPNSRFNGQTPLEMLRTETGARAVDEVLGQIDHGIFA